MPKNEHPCILLYLTLAIFQQRLYYAQVYIQLVDNPTTLTC
jgi:hypothetical protein